MVYVAYILVMLCLYFVSVYLNYMVWPGQLFLKGSNLVITVPPQGVEIQGPLQPFTSSREYFIACKVWGSNPPARIEWFRGTSPNHGLRPLKAHNQTVTEVGNVTISWLHYLPKPSHHHQTLICRGSNDELMSANSQTVEDYHRLEIFCE